MVITPRSVVVVSSTLSQMLMAYPVATWISSSASVSTTALILGALVMADRCAASSCAYKTG